jgi:hypothetical protein
VKQTVLAAGLFLIACCLWAAYLAYQRQAASPPPGPAPRAAGALPRVPATAPAPVVPSGNLRPSALPPPPLPAELTSTPANAPPPTESSGYAPALPAPAPRLPAELAIVPATAPAGPDLSGQWTVALHGNGHWYINIRRLGANRYRLAGGSALIAGDYELADDHLSKIAPAGSPSPCIWRLTAPGALEALTTGGFLHAGDPMTRTPPRQP